MTGMIRLYIVSIITAGVLGMTGIPAKTPVDPGFVDANKMITFETTDTGMMLIFKDGKGYYIEK